MLSKNAAIHLFIGSLKSNYMGKNFMLRNRKFHTLYVKVTVLYAFQIIITSVCGVRFCYFILLQLYIYFSWDMHTTTYSKLSRDTITLQSCSYFIALIWSLACIAQQQGYMQVAWYLCFGDQYSI